MNIGKWIIPDKMRAMPYHKWPKESRLYLRLYNVLEAEKTRDKSNDGPILLWLPEWLNVIVWELWAWWRRKRGLPVGE